MCKFDMYNMCDYSKTIIALCFNKIAVNSPKMAITPKHVGAN